MNKQMRKEDKLLIIYFGGYSYGDQLFELKSSSCEDGRRGGLRYLLDCEPPDGS